MTTAEQVQAPNYHRVTPGKGSGNGNGGDPTPGGFNAQARAARARQSITLAAVLSTLAVPFRGVAARRRKVRPARIAPSWGSGPPSLGALVEQTRQEWRDTHGRDLDDGESWLWRDFVAVLHALFGFAVRVPGGAAGHAVAWVFQEEYRFFALLIFAWFWL
jgi:hypothetical protein